MAGKPVAARGQRFSPVELEAARRVRLADIIADDLVVLFCGANPGLSSAAARAPFATPSDRWWPALYESGFTPRGLAPHEAHELPALDLALPVSPAARPSASPSWRRRNSSRAAGCCAGGCWPGGPDGWQCWESRRTAPPSTGPGPRWDPPHVGRPHAAGGLQEDTIGWRRLWILPNPSGLNAHYPPRALATEFARSQTTRSRHSAGLTRRPDLPLIRPRPQTVLPRQLAMTAGGTRSGDRPRRLCGDRLPTRRTRRGRSIRFAAWPRDPHLH